MRDKIFYINLLIKIVLFTIFIFVPSRLPYPYNFILYIILAVLIIATEILYSFRNAHRN
ncbi:MAG: hypothetical protein ACLSV2_15595 [Clostridium sp.]